MNYQLIYDRIVARGKERVLEGYKERHHIVPRCFGGTDDPDNLVELTPEEHYVCHQLLVKIHPGHVGLIYAANMMATCDAHGGRSVNKRYGWLKRKYRIDKVHTRVRVVIECANSSCGKSFEVRPSEIKYGKKTCCWSCNVAYRRSLKPEASWWFRKGKAEKERRVSLAT